MEMNMSYSKAFSIINRAEKVLGFPLTEKSIGGKGGGFIVKKYPEDVSLVFAKSALELYDIDTREDLTKLKEMSEND